MKLSEIKENLLLSECDSELITDIQSHLVRLNYLASLDEIDGILGPKTKTAFREWKIANFLTNYELIGPGSATKLREDRQQFKTRDLSIETLKKCFPNGKQWVEIYHYPLNFTMQKYDIMTPKRQSMFLAQIAHESGELRYKEELSSGHQYEGRLDLGNVKIGDGKRYKGRGLFQLTGRANYQEYGKSLGIDLINKPELAIEPLNSALIAGCYWAKKELNKFADLGTIESFKVITKRINGGLNGWEDRVKYWKRMSTMIFI